MGGETPSLAALFLACFKIGSLSFGGGLAGWIYREFVERHRWVTDEEFAANLAVAQILPGANVVNLVIGFGELLYGPVGAATCLIGFLVTPFFAVLALAALVEQVVHLQSVQWAMEGIAFAAIGMLIVICGRGVARLRHNLPALALMAVVAVGVGFMGWSMVAVVAVVAPVSIAVAAIKVRSDG